MVLGETPAAAAAAAGVKTRSIICFTSRSRPNGVNRAFLCTFIEGSLSELTSWRHQLRLTAFNEQPIEKSQLGPTVTGAVSGTAPLFALLAAALLLGETIPAQAAVAALAIGAGVALISWKQSAVRPGFLGWSLLWPISGAVVRGFAQAGAKVGLLLWPNPFAASLIGYSVSSATVIGVNRVGRSTRPKPTKHGIIWFAVTGMLNGGAVLLMYAALNIAPVSLVAPVVATYPLVTALASAVVLREEPLTRRVVAGATLTVLAIVYLVGSRIGA